MAVSQRLESRHVSFIPTVDEVYESALGEHKGAYDAIEPERMKALIGRTLERIVEFEDIARSPLYVNAESAKNIGTIWVHSGTGNYDNAFKAEDNPRLRLTPWMGGWDHARMSQAALLARKITEVRSGQTLEPASLSELPKQRQATKELIAAYGPTIVYSGYPVETAFADKLLDRPDIIIPRSKVKILHGDLKTTPDAVRTFAYPDGPEAKSKEVAVISHAPHLGARILHFMQHFQPLVTGSKPYMVPVATPEAGRKEFALMETRGLLYHIYITGLAAEETQAYQLLPQEQDKAKSSY